jgi:hypothetical protein
MFTHKNATEGVYKWKINCQKISNVDILIWWKVRTKIVSLKLLHNTLNHSLNRYYTVSICINMSTILQLGISMHPNSIPLVSWVWCQLKISANVLLLLFASKNVQNGKKWKWYKLGLIESAYGRYLKMHVSIHDPSIGSNNISDGLVTFWL